MDMLEGDESKKKSAIRVMNPKLRKKLLEEQKKRQREMLQKKMAAGVEFLGDTNVKLSKELANKNILAKILENIGKFLDALKPFKSDLV